MIQYFIINNGSRAAQYGIGSYVNQVAEMFNHDDKYLLSFIDLYADVKECKSYTDDLGICHYQIPPYSGGKEDEKYNRNLYYLIIQLIEEKDDLIFHFNYFHHYELAILLKSRFINSRIVLTVHYLEWCFELKGNITKFQEIINANLNTIDEKQKIIYDSFANEQNFMRLCDEIVLLSKRTLSLVVSDYKISENKLHLIYNGLNTNNSLLNKKIDKEELFSLEANKKYILFAGRLEDTKGLKCLINAFRSLTEKYKDIYLLIVGDGDYNCYLKQSRGLWNRIIYTGKVSKPQLFKFYKEAYMGILPSFNEQCSYSAIEMMSFGLPFIGTDSTGLKEMFEKIPEHMVCIDENSFSEESFEKELANKIEMLLINEKKRIELSSILLNKFHQYYTIDCMKTSYKKMFFEIFEKKHEGLSSDFYINLDNKMIDLINERPDINFDFFGLTGIGIYLWWRHEYLLKINDSGSISKSLFIQEYLIHYVDWIQDVLNLSDNIVEEASINYLLYILNKMNNKGFYKTKVYSLIQDVQNTNQMNSNLLKVIDLTQNEIINNALQIFNCRI